MCPDALNPCARHVPCSNRVASRSRMDGGCSRQQQGRSPADGVGIDHRVISLAPRLFPAEQLACGPRERHVGSATDQASGDRLAEHTRTPDLCWLAIWEGWDPLPDLDELDVPRLRMPGRNMVLLFGPITALVRTSFLDLWYSHSTNPANWYRSPSLWWTADRSWCVATDVDLKSTYLGGSRDCVSVLTSNNRLEVFEASAQQDITIEADTVNPEPEGDRWP